VSAESEICDTDDEDGASGVLNSSQYSLYEDIINLRNQHGFVSAVHENGTYDVTYDGGT
jgi:hypothetical protein